MATDLEQLQAYLDALRPQIKKNLTIVQPHDRPTPAVFHISKRKGIREFFPQMSRRAADSEDNTLPRVHVADTLVGCLIGYGAAPWDFIYNDVKGEEMKDYKGGYYIYVFENELTLRPTTRMVYDQVATGEQWLVPYKDPGQVYKAVPGGVFFMSEVSLLPQQAKDHVRMDATFYVELTKRAPWTNGIILEPGYYRIKGPLENRHLTYLRNKDYTVEQISKGDYMGVKTKEVALLSHQDTLASRWYARR